MTQPRRDPGGLPDEVVERLVAFMEGTSDLVGVTDDRGHVIYLNSAARDRLGVPGDDSRQLSTADLFPEAAFDIYFEQVRPRIERGEVWSGYMPVQGVSGEPLEMWVTILGQGLPGGEVSWLVVSARDVTEWRHVRDELNRQATHDELTGLATRTLLMDHLDVAMARARRTGEPVAVMFIDLDDLKAVNDSFGHRAGDEVLVEVGRRLLDAVRAIDTVARVGGDEFVVLFDGVDDEDEVDRLSTRVHAILESKAVGAGDALVNVSASIGVAVARDQETAAQLLGRADSAMYEMKAERRDLSGGPIDPLARPGAVTTHDVAVAITQGLIVPYYQPVFDAHRRSLVGFQALARWLRPGGQPVPAPEFLGVVEDSAVGFSLDLAILRQAALALADRDDQASLYVHVSTRFLHRTGVARFVREVLTRAELAPARLGLVLPIGLVSSSGARTAASVADLRDLGVRLVVALPAAAPRRVPLPIDDAMLRMFGELRIGLGGGADVARQSELGDLVADAHRRGLRVRASGVETEIQLDHLVALDCDFVEGRLLGPPLRSAL